VKHTTHPRIAQGRPTWRGLKSRRSHWAIALHIVRPAAFFRYLNTGKVDP
jgi:hypothetical protein